MNPKDYSTGEAARILGLPRRTVSRYCMYGRIPAFQHPLSKTWRIARGDLLRFIRDNGLDYREPAPPRRILIVDDDEGVTDYILRVLKDLDRDFVVDSSDNGYDALVKIGAEVPDLLFLDFKMPKMDGKEVLSALKRGEKTKRIKIIVVTGYFEMIDEMLGLGADTALAKPFETGRLVEAVNNLLPV